MTTPTELYETHRELLDRAIAAAGTRDYWSAVPGVAQQVGVRRGRRPGRRAGVPRPARHADFPIDVPGAAGSVATERSPYGFDLGVRYPKADPAALVAAARAATPGLARRRPAGPRRGRRRDPAPDQRPHLRAGARRAAHHRPGVRDGVPGRRRARAGPRPGGGGARAAPTDPACRPGHLEQAAARRRPAGAWTRRAPSVGARRGAGDRLHHLPDLERLSRACSRAWSPATR